MLKWHPRAVYGLSPEEYRSKWRLPPDYPMVPPNYAKQRSNFAKQIGLGRKKAKSPEPAADNQTKQKIVLQKRLTKGERFSFKRFNGYLC